MAGRVRQGLQGLQLFRTLNNSRLLESAEFLAQSDPDLARILQAYGPPPLWDREPGFETLIRIILEQQVSLASADAMFRRLAQSIKPLTPTVILAAGQTQLRSLGVTRQKAAYFTNIAEAIEQGELDLPGLAGKSDEDVFRELTAIKGIGPWTANIYLLMALCRPDIWPLGDIALATAYKNLKGWQQRPAQEDLDKIAKDWRPHRAIAARMLWHYYLGDKANRK